MKTIEKIKLVSIAENTSLLQAMEKMDEIGFKLLLITEGTLFKGLVSIGDIQRSIIKNQPLTTEVGTIIRPNAIVCNSTQTEAEVKEMMMQLRTVYMPIINNSNEIIDVKFWNEFVMQEHETPKFSFDVPVLIMAGGFGSRLKPLTNVIPKPLIPIGDKTILEEILNNFEKHGSKKFYFTVNYKSDFIEFYFRTQVKKKYDITYLHEHIPLGTAGSMFLSKPFIKETFFVSNCDIVINDDYVSMYNYHKTEGNVITLIASVKNYKIPYGTVESGEGGELLALKEKPELIFKINTGLYVLEPQALQYLNENEFIHITDLIERIKKDGGKIGVFPISNKSWYDIGEWAEYDKIINKYK